MGVGRSSQPVSQEEFLHALNRLKMARYRREVLFNSDKHGTEATGTSSSSLLYSMDRDLYNSQHRLPVEAPTEQTRVVSASPMSLAFATCSRDDAGSDHGPSFAHDNQTLLTFLAANVNWIRRTDSHQTAWYCCEGWEVDYTYDEGLPQPYNRMPGWMLALRAQMMGTLQLAEKGVAPPNSCNWNHYRTGTDGIGAHADDEYLFDGENRPIKVVGFSVGAPRMFQVCNKEGKVLEETRLPALGFVTMEGWFQRDFLHAVPPEPGLAAPRINVTWRWIVEKEKPTGRKKL